MQSVVTLTMNPAVDISTSVDRVAPVRKLRCEAPRLDPGGGGVNVARVITRFGGKATAIYPVGGATGELLHRLVDIAGVQSATFSIAEETRFSFTVLENETGQEYRFLLPGPSLSASEWRQGIQELRRLSNRPDILVMSGSLPPGAPADFYAMIALETKSWGAKLVLDSSGPALTAALREQMYLIKPNLNELRKLTGQKLEDEKSSLAACRELIKNGRAAVIALTLGGQGALLVTSEFALRAPAPPIRPASAVGAGDSFLGVMVWALAAGYELQEAFRYGVAAGSAALITPGTELCRREDVERLRREVNMVSV